jgi:hypothetical protein
VKHTLAIAAVAALVSSGSVMAAPLLNLTVEASTTSNGTFSSTLASAPAAGSTLYFELVAQFAATGTTNTNTSHSPNGTTDSISSLPDFTLASSGSTFDSTSLQNNFSTGNGAVAGITGGSSLDIRAIEQGFTELADSSLVIVSGTFTVGSAFTGISGSTDTTVNTNNIPDGATSGAIKVSGSLVAISATTEASSDPLLHYNPLVVEEASAVPAPSILSGVMMLTGIGALSLIRRRTADLA